MPLDITFTLSDSDLQHFQAAVDKAKTAIGDDMSPDDVVAAAIRLVEKARATELPRYIGERLLRLQVIIDMLRDTEWGLGEQDRKRVLGALTYFCAPDDLIHDSIPGFGFLDDAIYVELVLRELHAEVTSYEEFCVFRAAEEKRLSEQGLDPRVDRDAWLASKREALQTRMSKLRKAGRRWRLRW